MERQKEKVKEVNQSLDEKMDIQRVKYSLSKYLRTRILKIEDQCEAIMVNFDSNIDSM